MKKRNFEEKIEGEFRFGANSTDFWRLFGGEIILLCFVSFAEDIFETIAEKICNLFQKESENIWRNFSKLNV